MHLLPYAIVWAVLATVVIILAVARSVISRTEDDSLHVNDSTRAAVAQQTEVFHKLEVIDKWGKILTVVAVVTGLALGAAFIYDLWEQGTRYTVR